VRALAWIGLVIVYFVLVVLSVVALGFLGMPVQAWLEAGNLTPLRTCTHLYLLCMLQ
jgi:hypothetical protein